LGEINVLDRNIFHPQPTRGGGETDYRAETIEAPATESQNGKTTVKKHGKIIFFLSK